MTSLDPYESELIVPLHDKKKSKVNSRCQANVPLLFSPINIDPPIQFVNLQQDAEPLALGCNEPSSYDSASKIMISNGGASREIFIDKAHRCKILFPRIA